MQNAGRSMISDSRAVWMTQDPFCILLTAQYCAHSRWLPLPRALNRRASRLWKYLQLIHFYGGN